MIQPIRFYLFSFHNLRYTTMADPTKPENTFRTIVKSMTSCIKLYHHLTHVNSDPTTPIPNNLKLTQEQLISTVLPARPNDKTNLLKTGNAMNWTHTTVQILEEHYKKTLDDCINNLSLKPKEDWEQAFLIATRWAKKDMKRITEKTILEAKTKIFQIQTPSTSTTNKTPDNMEQENPTVHTLTESTPPKKRVDVAIGTQDFGPSEPLYAQEKPTTPEISSPQIPILTPPYLDGSEPLTTNKTPENMGQEISTIQPLAESTPKRRRMDMGISTQEFGPSQPLYKSVTPDTHNETLSPVLPPTYLGDSEPLYKTHAHEGNKYLNWSLSPSRPILILGDSNISRLPYIRDSRIQVDCYPGANLSHAAHLIKNKTPTSDIVQKVILSFGINNRKMNHPNQLGKDLQAMLKAARDTFPQGTIYIPIINYSKNQPQFFQDNIKFLNQLIRNTAHQIPEVQEDRFSTLPDNLHWDKQTALEMANHWISFLV